MLVVYMFVVALSCLLVSVSNYARSVSVVETNREVFGGLHLCWSPRLPH